MSTKLNLLDQFPDMTLTTAGGEALRLPVDVDADYAVILFYRGHW